MCRSHSTVREILGAVIETTRWAAITDMEAGLEHLKRGTAKHVDTMLVVVEPYYKSLETGHRSCELARELGVPHIVTVANKMRGQQDESIMADFCNQHGIELASSIPFDETVMEADRLGRAPLDVYPDSPALTAIAELGEKLRTPGN